MIHLFLIAGLVLSTTPAAFAQRQPDQRPDSFVDAASVAPGLFVEARYATAHNFVGVPIDGYEKPLCYLSRLAAAALALVVQDLEARGLKKSNGVPMSNSLPSARRASVRSAVEPREWPERAAI